MARVVIVGAGLTGLSTAYHLEQLGFFDYVILEKESEIGGLCRSVTNNNFTFDYTGHLLHINDPYVKTLIENLIGFNKFNYIPRESFIYSQQVYTRYPFQINLYGLPVDTIASCIEGFITRKKIRDPKTFYSWVLTNFGHGFAHHFFIPYQEKQFCHSAKKFSAQWTGRFVPQTSLQEIIQGALTDQSSTIGYNAHFYYPKNSGISILPHAFAQQLINPIQTNHEVKQINLTQKILSCTNGAEYPFDVIINTSPLNTVLQKTIDTSASDFANQHHKLQASSVLNINLGLAQSSLTKKHWIYFPEKHFPFYRMGFYHNFSATLAPTNYSSLYLECAYHSTYQPELISQAVKKSCKLFNIPSKNIINTTLLHLPTAYTLYTPWRDKNIKNLLARLQEVGIYSIGRYGSWKYASMQEAIIDGQQAAQQVASTQGEFGRKFSQKQQMARV